MNGPQKFRSRPVEITAEQYRGEDARSPHGLCCCDVWKDQPHVHGRHGAIVVKPGDWIIAEPDGCGFYPCAADVFAAKYAPADAERDAVLAARTAELRARVARFNAEWVRDGGIGHLSDLARDVAGWIRAVEINTQTFPARVAFVAVDDIGWLAQRGGGR